MINILGCCTRRLRMNVFTTSFRSSHLKISNKLDIILKQTDHVPRDFQLIYRAPSSAWTGLTYHLVNFFAFTSIGTVLYAWFVDKPKLIEKKKSSKTDVPMPEFLLNPLQTTVVCSAMVLIVVLLSNVRRKSALRVYLHPDGNSYTAYFIGKYPYSTESYTFQKGTVTYMTTNSIFPWESSSYIANGRKILLYSDYFKSQADLHNMFDEYNVKKDVN